MTATVTDIRKAMADLAAIIEASPVGDKYWPIFERLEREIATRDTRAERLAAARRAVAA
ncbi:hypothetical protein [Rhizobium leguminosarum]|uniref:hypothetical protein n=1 Tax=Rhizobium leguminosarum TaxID=384 RepID=UPI001441FE57|nr:hypothetical protein [Rhizobium leguminosarum]MBY5863239.1 hypothetical protein [Rhizobium leguminosarum]